MAVISDHLGKALSRLRATRTLLDYAVNLNPSSEGLRRLVRLHQVAAAELERELCATLSRAIEFDEDRARARTEQLEQHVTEAKHG